MARYTIRPIGREAARYRIDYRAALNEAQYEAVTALEGPVLVVAGAGSGKTRTLTYRVARLVESGVEPGSVLLLTFTRRAAEEMIRRAEALLRGGGLGAVTGGTFHSFAHLVLRRYAREYGWPERFTILDRSDAEDAIGLVRARLGLDRSDRRFPRKQTLQAIFSAAVNRGLDLREVVEDAFPHLLDDLADMARCREAYEAYKREQSLLDYDDLLLRLRDRLAELPELAERLGRVHRYVMVDEYQDTNYLQAEIVARIAGERANLMVVGDDAQAIYGFRGADVRHILAFGERFPGARRITLEENYRSTQPILDVGNALIAAARERYTKTLFTRRREGARPMLVPAPDERLESMFVRQRVLELHEDGVPLSEIAVLFRSAYHSFELELELARAGVPFIKRGGFRFVETAHVKDVLAHLRVIENPADEVAWHRILLLLDGVGPRAAGAVGEWVARGPGSAAALAEAPVAGRLRPLARQELARLGALLGSLEAARDRPAELAGRAVEYYLPILDRRHRDDAPRRRRDLEQLEVLAGRYRSLAEMLADMALEPPRDSVEDRPAVGGLAEGERLTLSTVHSAKGLEWHTVFVVSLIEGRLPSAYSSEPAEIEEERRLLYVACTRARENLILTYPSTVRDRSLGLALARPSRFLDDVPGALLDVVTLEEE